MFVYERFPVIRGKFFLCLLYGFFSQFKNFFGVSVRLNCCVRRIQNTVYRGFLAFGVLIVLIFSNFSVEFRPRVFNLHDSDNAVGFQPRAVDIRLIIDIAVFLDVVFDKRFYLVGEPCGRCFQFCLFSLNRNFCALFLNGEFCIGYNFIDVVEAIRIFGIYIGNRARSRRFGAVIVNRRFTAYKTFTRIRIVLI